MRILIVDAHQLAIDVLNRAGMQPEHSAIVTDHIIHVEASGEAAGGLARVLSLVDEFRDRPRPTPIRIEKKAKAPL